MSRLYPTLEDLKVDELKSAQHQLVSTIINEPASNSPNQLSLYPALNEYLGMKLDTAQNQAVQPYGGSWRSNVKIVAPVTQNSVGVVRSEIKQGLRRVKLCKDSKGMVGLRMQAVDKGLFVSFVQECSPASMAGVRFGDQILEINGNVVAGWTTDQSHKYIKKCPPNDINMVLRDRPFERTVTMNKDSNGYIGFVFSDGKITHLVKDSSAARNGLLVDHKLIEVDGQNVIGLKDKQIQRIIDGSVSSVVTVTVMPLFVYDHMIKS